MSVFVDANVLVYARDASEPEKQPQAAAWIGHRGEPEPLAWRPVSVGTDLLELGWSIEDRFGLSCWDALIVAAARTAGAAGSLH